MTPEMILLIALIGVTFTLEVLRLGQRLLDSLTAAISASAAF